MIVLGLVIWINCIDHEVFVRFLGHVNPVMATFLCGLTCTACLGYLGRRFRLPVFRWPALKSSLVPLTGALVFGAIVIVIDLWLRLPKDLNIRFPVSMAFYPAIGFIAVVIFQIGPFTLVALFITGIKVFTQREKVLGTSIVAASLFEPLYQIFILYRSGLYDLFTLVIIGIHVWLISLFQLSVFKRSGFYHMYLFRLAYYLIWHVVWGYFRLHQG